DPDVVKEHNLNRILNASLEDARERRPKVNVLRDAATRASLGTVVEVYTEDVWSPKIVKRLSECDVLFGCVDAIDARQLLNRLATFYLVPYFDVGVKLIADGRGGLEQVCGSVHYLKPGGSSLLSRGVYTSEEVRAATLRRTSPEAYEREQGEGYIIGAQ